MSRFNSKKVTVSKIPNAINAAGGLAFKQSDKLEFASLLLTSMIQDQFYRSAGEQITRVEELVSKAADKKFLAQTAIFTRNEFGMRSVSHVAAAEIAKNVKGADWTRKFFEQVVRRPDDMSETIAYYLAKYGKPLPNSLKRGFAKAFDKFSEYQLAKYRGEGKDVSLVDVVNLCRPCPTKTNKKALKALMKGDLKSIDTWESMLTEAGKAGDEDDVKSQKAEVWDTLLTEGKLGYMAALRNINNIMEQASDETFEKLLVLLKDPDAVKKSLVFPYRFLTAIENLKGDEEHKIRKAKVALSIALDNSCKNIPILDGKTLVVCDYSGSMGDGNDSHKGKGSIFGAILAKANCADFMIFGDTAAYVPYDPTNSAISLAAEFMSNNQSSGFGFGTRKVTGKKVQVGHGTNFNSIFQNATQAYDRIVIFSDMQGWAGGGAPGTSFKAYCKKFDCNPNIFSVDLTGHGDMMFPEKKVFCLAGFSDKIFDIMHLLEQDRNALVNKIESVVIG